VTATAANARSDGADAGANGRQLVDQVPSVGVLHGEGHTGALRRPLPPLPDAPGGAMTPVRVSIIAAIAAIVLLVVIFELIRSRRLQERYAMLWLLSGIVIFVLAVWRGALCRLAALVGIACPPSALFVLRSFFILVLLLHYSTVISKLSDQNQILAQRLALLENRLDEDTR